MNKTQTYSFDLPKSGVEIDGRYRVADQIGEGSYGWVFSVEHLLLGQTFAMKILHPRIASDPSWIARFREEAKSTSLIGHENIVFVTDFGKCPTYGYYFVMEYLVGKTLEDELNRHLAPGREVPAAKRRLDAARSIRIALQAASALSAAHDLGIVHRDLKPGNIMLVERSGKTDACKLLDFGISSIVLAAAKTAKLYGTPAYMAPEQAIQPDIDHRADQFSLATILYEMLTGQTPWKTRCWDDATPAGRVDPPAPPSRLGAKVSEALDRVILKALSVPFEDRFASIDDFSRGLVTAGKFDWIPESDPFDSFRGEDTDIDLASPQVSVSSRGAGESMIIVLDEGDVDVRPLVTVRFRTPGRLIREYRRNLLAGGLFLPSEETLPVQTEIDLELVYEPGPRSIELGARVVASRSATAGGRSGSGNSDEIDGFGVAIAANDAKRLTGFLRSLNLGLELSQADILRPLHIPLAERDLSAAEAFLYSRINEPMPVAQVRVFSSGLPFDVEQGIQSLVEKGLLEIEAADLSSLSETSAIHGLDENSESEASLDEDGELAAMANDITRFPWTSPGTDRQASDGPSDSLEEPAEINYSSHEVSRVLTLMRYFKARQNYFGAMQVLRKALELSPSVPEFYHQLALLHAEFGGDYPRAFQALHGAIQLDPTNATYQETRAKLERLAGVDEEG